jgi:hypothetical protein
MKFIAPGYLFGLALMAVPVIIHLWYRRRMKKVPFSSLEFIKKTEARKLGWLRLREILILACRCLFVGLFFFSLSRPQAGEENRRASVYLIFDDTYSMGYADNFSQARKAAARMIAGYAPNAEFHVAGLAATDSAEIIWLPRAQALEKIKKIPLTYGTGSIGRILERRPARDNSYPLEYAYVGDGQELNFRDYRPTPGAKFFWIRIRTGQNCGVVRASPRDPVRPAGEGYPVSVRLNNYGLKLWPGRIEVEAGIFFLQQDCRLLPGQETEEVIAVPGNVRCGRLNWQTDSLAADNEYYFAFPRSRPLRVLIIGRPGFLERALDPSRDLKTPFSIRTAQRISDFPDLRSNDVIIMDGTPDLTEAEASRMENFLSLDKRAVLCFLGDRVGGNLKKFLARCAAIGEPVLPRGYANLERIDFDHYAFSPFKGSAGLKDIKIYKFWDLVRRGRVLAGLSAGSDLVVVKDNLTVVGTRFDPDYTDLVYKAVFVPLVHRLVWSPILAQSDREYLVGDRSEHIQTLTGPRGRNVGAGDVIEEPGLYAAGADTIAVNIVPEEGDLKPVGDNLRKVLGIRELDLDRKRGIGDLSWLALILALAMVLVEQVLLLV